MTALVPSAGTAPISQFRAVFQSVVPAAPLKVAVVCAPAVASPKVVNKAQANARERFARIFMMGLRMLFSFMGLVMPMAACFMVYLGSDLERFQALKSIFSNDPDFDLNRFSSFILSDVN